MHKNWIIGAILTVIVIVAGIGGWVFSNDEGSEPQNEPNGSSAPTNSTVPEENQQPPPSPILWNRTLQHQATDLVAQDAKVFIMDRGGIISCFDSQTGALVWNTSIGDEERSHKITVSETRVYVAFQRGKISCLDKTNGTLLWVINKFLYDYVYPNVSVDGNLLTVIGEGLSFHNAETGELVNDFGSFLKHYDFPAGRKALLQGDYLDGDYVYAVIGETDRKHFYKIRWRNGEVIWQSRYTWDGSMLRIHGIFTPSIVEKNQDKLILRITSQGFTTVDHLLCFDARTGEQLWTIDTAKEAGAGAVLRTKIYDDLFFMIREDGYLHAIDLDKGTPEWKTKIDTQNLFSASSISNHTVQMSSIEIDEQNQRLFFYFNGANNASANNSNETICSINPSNGTVYWIKHLEPKNNSFGNFVWRGVNLVFNAENDKIYLSKQPGLWIFNYTTGDLIHTELFNDYMSSPIPLENKIYVVADLQLVAFN